MPALRQGSAGNLAAVTSSDDHARELQELLDRFDPERHGGEFSKSGTGGNKRRLGFLKEKLDVTDDFDIPLPEDVFKDRPD